MIRFALLGAGAAGSVHAANLAAHPECELTVIAEQDAERGGQLAQRFGGQVVKTAAAALDYPVDAVIVASSTAAHAEHVAAVLQAGLHCLCEKPLTIGLAPALDCLALARRTDVVVVMGFNRRLDRDYREMHQRVRAGAIGEVEMIHFASRGVTPPAPETAPLSGGMLREKGVHFYDLASWICDAEPVEVYVAGACLIDSRFADYDDVDTAAVTLRLSSGALATFDFGRRCRYGQDEFVEVFGAAGLLQTGRQPGGNVYEFRARETVHSGLHRDWHSQFERSYVAELARFVEAIRGRPADLPDLAAGVRAQAVAEAAIRSHKTARPVTIDNVWD